MAKSASDTVETATFKHHAAYIVIRTKTVRSRRIGLEEW